MTVGDIHWVQLPAANGHEQRGSGPAVILQDDHYAGGLPVVLVVPLTTARATMRFAGTVLIHPTAENGSPQVLVALVFQLRAIDRRRVQERIGSIGETVLEALSRTDAQQARRRASGEGRRNYCGAQEGTIALAPDSLPLQSSPTHPLPLWRMKPTFC